MSAGVVGGKACAGRELFFASLIMFLHAPDLLQDQVTRETRNRHFAA
jgi:hypothetical protein